LEGQKGRRRGRGTIKAEISCNAQGRRRKDAKVEGHKKRVSRGEPERKKALILRTIGESPKKKKKLSKTVAIKERTLIMEPIDDPAIRSARKSYSADTSV